MSDQETPTELSVDVERFGRQNPCIQGSALMEAAREALGVHHESPARMDAALPEGERRLLVAFAPADHRTGRTYERQRVVEDGAVVIAGLVLNERGLRIQRVTETRGGHFDYFVGERAAGPWSLLEVSGTDDQPVEARAREKLDRLMGSTYRKPPHRYHAFVSVTRFGPPSVTLLRTLAPEGETTTPEGEEVSGE